MGENGACWNLTLIEALIFSDHVQTEEKVIKASIDHIFFVSKEAMLRMEE